MHSLIQSSDSTRRKASTDQSRSVAFHVATLEAQDFDERLVLEVAKHSSKNMASIIASLVQVDWPEGQGVLDTVPSLRPAANQH